MYENYFNLHDAPFQLTPDPRYFFGSSGHKRAYDYLKFGLSHGEGFIVVTGEVGAGKTTLIGRLLDNLDQSRFATATIVSTQVGPDDLLRLVAGGFGIDHAEMNKASLLEALQREFGHLASRQITPVVLVDEAQNLPVDSIEELRMLSNFGIGRRAALMTVLVGQPQFRDKLQHRDLAQLRQRVVVSYHLGPLTAQETEIYIRHRLTHAGWKDDPVIRDGALRGVYKSARGIPRLINVLMNRILLHIYLEERHEITAKDVDQVAEDLSSEIAALDRPGPSPSSDDLILKGEG